MNTNKLAVLSSTIACALLMLTSLSAQAAEELVRWDRIDGIVPNPSGGQVIAGLNPVTFPWTVSQGKVVFNATTGRMFFDLKGLAIGAGPTNLALIGTSGAVQSVKGTVICNTTGEMLDTEAVSLSSKGDASFYGRLPYALTCDDGSWVFLLRIAGVVPGAPPISERWLAHGAVRTFRTLGLRADDE